MATKLVKNIWNLRIIEALQHNNTLKHLVFPSVSTYFKWKIESLVEEVNITRKDHGCKETLRVHY